MKQKLLNNLRLRAMMLVAVLCTVANGTAWGDDTSSIEINTTNSGVTGSYKDATFDVNNITFGFSQWMKSTNIQAKKSTTNSCYNVDAIPGTITSIVVEQAGTARAITMYGGTSEKPTIKMTSPTTASKMTFDFTGNNYNYFSLTTPGNACYFDKITINYIASGGGNLEESDFALTDAPIALSFDLYNKAIAQVINYTTSSTGIVTVSASDYVTTTVDATNKTITVTPKAETPSAQTITVSQAADETYAAGEATFTVTIDDSTPIPTHKVTFSINGETSTEDVEEGADITFPVDPADIHGKTFRGWVTSTIDGTTDDTPSFVTSATMGDADITYYAVYATAKGSGSDSWTATSLSDLISSDIFVIVGNNGNNGNNYAMTNNNGTGSAPAATSVTIKNGAITNTVADNMKWNVSGNSTDGYTFYPNGSTTTWLYCTNNNNGLRVGTGTDKSFKINNNYLYNSGQSRYIGVYSSQDWRSYTSINTNISEQTFAFYKYTAGISYSEYCTTVAAPVAVTGVSLNKTSTSLFVGDNETLTATVAPADASNKKITWESSDEGVATVEDGVVTAVGKGTATITVKSVADNTKTATCAVTVNPVAVTGVSLNKSSATIYTGSIGNTVQLTATVSPSNATDQAVTWTSSDETKATVSSTGLVTAVAVGTTTITVTTADGGLTATCNVTIEEAPGSENKPYTIAQAIDAIDNGGNVTSVYVRGIVSQVDGYSDSKYITYWISDDGTTTNQFQAYKGLGISGASFASTDDVKVGDRVVVTGNIILYSSTTYEFSKENQLVSQVRDFTFTLEDMSNGSVAVEVNGVAKEPNGSGEITIASGSTVALTATPSSEYVFGKWTCTEDDYNNSTDNPLEFTMPFDDIMFGATFVDAAAKYDIVADDAVSGGSISIDKTEAKAGETVTLTATPSSGYVFGSWDVRDENSVSVTVTENQFTMPASDVTVTATFKPIYTVTYYIGGVQNSTTRVSGEALNLETPSTGFAGWSTANSAASPAFVENDMAVTGNTTLYAVFISDFTTEYQLVEAEQADWRGDYLIAYSSTIFADGRKGGTDGMGKQNTSVDPGTKLSNKVVDLEWGDTYKVTLEAIDNSDLSRGYVLKTQDGKYNYQTSNSNGLPSTANKETAAAYPITVTFTSSSDVKLSLGGNATGAVFRYNTGGYFRFYKDGGQNAVYLYKRAQNATYSLDIHEPVTVGSACYTTYVTKHDVSFENVTAYIATKVNTSTIHLDEVASAPAGTPVVIKAEAGTYFLPVITTTPAAVTGNLLQASDGSVAGDGSTIFALGVGKSGENEGQVGFYLVKDGQTVPAGKAYMVIDEGSDVKGFTFDFDGTTTGIGLTPMDEAESSKFNVQSSKIYNLAGQRLSKMQKGINIVGGKKVLVK